MLLFTLSCSRFLGTLFRTSLCACCFCRCGRRTFSQGGVPCHLLQWTEIFCCCDMHFIPVAEIYSYLRCQVVRICTLHDTDGTNVTSALFCVILIGRCIAEPQILPPDFAACKRFIFGVWHLIAAVVSLTTFYFRENRGNPPMLCRVFFFFFLAMEGYLANVISALYSTRL